MQLPEALARIAPLVHQVAAAREGVHLDRRGDVDPAAVLDVVVLNETRS